MPENAAKKKASKEAWLAKPGNAAKASAYGIAYWAKNKGALRAKVLAKFISAARKRLKRGKTSESKKIVTMGGEEEVGGVRRGGLLVGAVGDEEEEVEVGSGSGGVGGYGQAKSIEFKFQNKTTFSVATIVEGEDRISLQSWIL